MVRCRRPISCLRACGPIAPGSGGMKSAHSPWTLVVFLFVMTGIVYETQHWTNPEIRTYVDALYFTVTALIP